MPGLHDQKSAVGSRRQYVGRCGAALSSFGFPRLIRKSPRIRSASGSSRQILQIAIEQAMIGNRVGWLLLEEVPNRALAKSAAKERRGLADPAKQLSHLRSRGLPFSNAVVEFDAHGPFVKAARQPWRRVMPGKQLGDFTVTRRVAGSCS